MGEHFILDRQLHVPVGIFKNAFPSSYFQLTW